MRDAGPPGRCGSRTWTAGARARSRDDSTVLDALLRLQCKREGTEAFSKRGKRCSLGSGLGCSCEKSVWRRPRHCRRRTSRRRASTCHRIRDSPARNSNTGASVANRGCGASAASRATGAATSARRDQRPRRRRAQRSVLLPVICGPRRRAQTRSLRRRRPAAAARRRACSTLPREIGRRRLPAARPAERTASAGPEESRASASSVACRGARR